MAAMWRTRRHEATLLAFDSDLEHVARVIGIDIDGATRSW
jgi:hypothetical protein